MTLEQVLDFLKPFSAVLKPELMSLEAQGLAELNSIVAGVSSPDLKLLLQCLAEAIDKFAQAEISKLP